jgi:hypothetical protein
MDIAVSLHLLVIGKCADHEGGGSEAGRSGLKLALSPCRIPPQRAHALNGGPGPVSAKTERRPAEELRHALDLIVMAAIRKSHQLVPERAEPACLPRR